MRKRARRPPVAGVALFLYRPFKANAPTKGTFPVPVADFVRDGKCPQNSSESRSEGISVWIERRWKLTDYCYQPQVSERQFISFEVIHGDTGEGVSDGDFIDTVSLE